MNNFLKILRIIVASSITTFFIHAFTENAYRALWAGVFICILYAFYEVGSDMIKSVEHQEEGLFFTHRFMGIMVFSLFILGTTTFITEIIHSELIIDHYCEKESFFYSERDCALQNVKENFYEEYDGSDDY